MGKSGGGVVARDGTGRLGVASTNAFNTPLVCLSLLTLALALAQVRGRLSDAQEHEHLKALRHMPVAVQAALALKLKEISCIHG